MQDEEAGPPDSVGDNGAAALSGTAPSTPRGMPSVRWGRGAAGGTAASCSASVYCAPAAPAVPVVPTTPAVARGAARGCGRISRPSRGARPSGAACAAMIVEEGENEWME